MEHIVRFRAGYDCFRFECKFGSERCLPCKGSSHGKHGLEILFFSKGDQGAVQFVLATSWPPQLVVKDTIGYRSVANWGDQHVYPVDLGYHSKEPRYEGQSQMTVPCEFCDNQPCYCDGSGLNAADAMYALVNGGSEALWAFLDAYYATLFGGAPYPEPAEYPTPLRKGAPR